MVVMPTILTRSCSCAWDHYLVERPTYLDPYCNYVQWTIRSFLRKICSNAYSSYLRFCTMLPAQKSSCIPKSSNNQHSSRSDEHVEVQHVLHLKSNTMTYHMSVTHLSLSRHQKVCISNHQWSNSRTFEQTLRVQEHVYKLETASFVALVHPIRPLSKHTSQ